MSDIATVYIPTTGTFDWKLENGQLKVDNGLTTAATLSLFTDARAQDSDSIPDGGDDRRGWWGDTFPEIKGDAQGSRLWLFARAKDTPATLESVREAAAAALAWLREDEIADRVEVVASRLRPGVLSLAVAIVRPDRSRADLRFYDLWKSMVTA